MDQSKQIALLMAGGGAAGKTTTTKAFVEGKPEEHKELKVVPTRKGMQEAKVFWTLFDNCGLAGNYHSGTDANVGPGATEAAFLECADCRDIVIVDGMISTPKWIEMCNRYANEKNPNMEILLLYFNLPAEALLSRLANRRKVDKESIRASMWDKCVGLVRRAELLVLNCEKLAKIPYTVLEVYEEDTTEDIVELLDIELCELFQDCEDD